MRTGSHRPAANAITAVRAVLTVGAGRSGRALVRHDVPVALVVALASVALATDAIDGQVARRTGTVEPLRRPLRHGDRRRAAAGAQHVRRPRRRPVGAGHRPGPLRLPGREGAPALVAGAGASAAVVQGRRRPAGRRAAGRRVGPAPRTGRRRCAPRGPGPAGRVLRPRGLGPLARPAAAPPAALGHPADRPARVPGGLGGPGRPRRDRCGLARGLRPDPARRAWSWSASCSCCPRGRRSGWRRAPAWCSAC